MQGEMNVYVNEQKQFEKYGEGMYLNKEEKKTIELDCKSYREAVERSLLKETYVKRTQFYKICSDFIIRSQVVYLPDPKVWDKDEICPVCQDQEVENENKTVIQMQCCSSKFHEICLQGWFDSSCRCPCCPASMFVMGEVAMECTRRGMY